LVLLGSAARIAVRAGESALRPVLDAPLASP
jgi:hypothetical protein